SGTLAALEHEVDANFDRLMNLKLAREEESFTSSGLAESNYLIRILEFVEQTIVTCTITCMICNSRLEYAGFKPVVCNDRLCLYKYEELGLGVDLSSEIRNNPEVTDLLISFAAAATSCDRIELCFPENVCARLKDGREISFMKGRSQNVSLLAQVINCIPPVGVMARYGTSKEL